MSLTPYYEDAAVRLFHGDCRDILPQLEAVDHVITDPPYSDWVHAKVRRGGSFHTPDRTDGGVKRPVISSAAVLGFDALDAETRAICAREFGRLARRWVLVFSDVESAADWRSALVTDGGLEYVRTGAWVKLGATPQFTGDRPASGFEAITIAHPKGRKRWNGGGQHALWTHPVVGGSARAHTTQKPETLMSELIAQFTDEGDTIVDPFAGSGTTAVAAKKVGRRCVLIESREQCCEAAARRLSIRLDALEGGLFSQPEASDVGYGHGV